MKKLLNLLFIIPIIAFAACNTSDPVQPNPGPDPGTNVVTTNLTDRVERMAYIVESSAQLGVYGAINYDTNSIAYFKLAVQLIDVAIKNNTYDPEQLIAAMKSLSIREADNELVLLSINSAINLYRVLWGDVVAQNLNRTTYLKPVLQALARGIRLGLDARATEQRHGIQRPRKSTNELTYPISR